MCGFVNLMSSNESCNLIVCEEVVYIFKLNKSITNDVFCDNFIIQLKILNAVTIST